jgi:hypothetical protein
MKTLQAHHLKMKRNRRRKRLIFSFIFGFLLAIVLLGYLFLLSPVFKIKKIEVSQTHVLDSIVIKQGIQMILNQGFIFGPLIVDNNILFIPNRQINDYLKGFSVIESYVQNKNIFSRVLKIDIQEREIAGILKQPVAKNYYFDKDGIIFSEAPDSEGEVLPIIESGLNRSFDLGSRILELTSFQELMRVVQLLDDNFPNTQVKLGKDKSEIILMLDNGKEMSLYLNLNNLSQTYSVLSYFIQNNFDFNLEYLDLRYLPNVYYK